MSDFTDDFSIDDLTWAVVQEAPFDGGNSSFPSYDGDSFGLAQVDTTDDSLQSTGMHASNQYSVLDTPGSMTSSVGGQSDPLEVNGNFSPSSAMGVADEDQGKRKRDDDSSVDKEVELKKIKKRITQQIHRKKKADELEELKRELARERMEKEDMQRKLIQSEDAYVPLENRRVPSHINAFESYMKCVHTMGDVLANFGTKDVANNALRPLLGEAMDLMYRVCPTAGNTNTTLMAMPPHAAPRQFAPSLPCSLTEDPAEMMKEWRVLVKNKMQLTQDQQIRTAKRRAELLIKLKDVFKKRGNTATQIHTESLKPECDLLLVRSMMDHLTTTIAEELSLRKAFTNDTLNILTPCQAAMVFVQAKPHLPNFLIIGAVLTEKCR